MSARSRSLEPRRYGPFGRIATPTPLPVGDINTYLIFPEDPDGPLALVDTGVRSPEAFAALRAGITALGGALERIEQILVTHAHMDHFGQAKRLRDLTGARVYASGPEARFMASPTPSVTGVRDAVTLAWFRRWGIPDEIAHGGVAMRDFAKRLQEPIEVDAELADGDALEVAGRRIEVIATPGHCPGHLVFWEPTTRTLCSGDHLLPDISPVPLLDLPREEGQPRPRSLIRFLDSLERVERLDCALALPSHGDVIEDHHRVIRSYRLHHERRRLQFVRYLKKGPRTPFEVARRMFPRHYESQIYLVMSEVIGHLDVLESDGLLAIEERGDGVDLARLVALPDPPEDA